MAWVRAANAVSPSPSIWRRALSWPCCLQESLKVMSLLPSSRAPHNASQDLQCF